MATKAQKASTKARAAPRLTRKGEETRERVVAAAAALIFERGVAGTSIEDVKEAAGPQQIPISVRFQTCNGHICQPPKTVKLSVPVTVRANG